jgi:hypothetical protein
MGGVQDARDNLKKSVTIFFTAAEQSHQFPNLPKSKSGKSGDFEIGLWSLAGADFETGATERVLRSSKDSMRTKAAWLSGKIVKLVSYFSKSRVRV